MRWVRRLLIVVGSLLCLEAPFCWLLASRFPISASTFPRLWGIIAPFREQEQWRGTMGRPSPGTPGNNVMFGHVSGPYETLGRLKELEKGDVMEVYTESRVWTYKVTESKVIPPTEVTGMAPTPDATLTVITCAGEQNLLTRQYPHRLAATAKLAGSAPLEG